MRTTARNITLYPWLKFFQNLIFWQATWFLYFQGVLSAAEAIALYAVYDLTTTVLEVPSGYISDRFGRRPSLLLSAVCAVAGMVAIVFGGSFAAFALGQALMGGSAAFASGTDSAILYESLAAEGREAEVEAQELRAWRFNFIALALSAVTGGAMAYAAPVLPFAASALSLCVMLLIATRMAEPPRSDARITETVRFNALKEALAHPVLGWLFALAVLMYGFSHLPFVFGQPFILEALDGLGLAAQAPLVSGGVSAVMMLLSVAVSLAALRLRNRLGLPLILLSAFALQIVTVGVLSATASALAIAFLFLRMVPDALSRPFILARIQPLLEDQARATYLSLQALVGRMIFAATLLIAAGQTSDIGLMPAADIQRILGWYAIGGLLCLGALALVATRLRIEAR